VASPDGRAAAPALERSPEALVLDAVDQLQPGRGSKPAVHGARVARLKQAVATSAGGIVIRFQDGAPQLVVGKRLRERDGVTWTLPKGTPNAGETTEQTALREVAEETGLEVRIVRRFDSIDYWFVQGGTRIHKTVHYFLMAPAGGDLGRHDREFDEVRWIGFSEVPRLLTFETERALVARAALAVADGTFAAPILPPGAGEA
jgi:8-oxo-dGTP pyrophosphatase MutT (NUDIX family)